MNTQWPLLICSPDPLLRDEVESAVTRLDVDPPVVHVAANLLRGVETARARQPRIALLDVTEDFDALRSLTRELSAVAPETVLVGVYRLDSLSSQVWDRTAQGGVFVEGLRLGLRDFLRRPISATDLEQLFGRVLSTPRTTPARVGTTIAFISNKGGVGKSTLAVNVACRLAQKHPERVLLLDCSLQMGVCASMLDLQPKTTLLDAARERTRLDETLLRKLTTPHSSGLELLAAPPDAISASELEDETISRVLALARRVYDYVLVDTFPLFDRTVISLLDVCDLSYLVLENVVPTVLSAVKLVELMNGLGYSQERRRVVVNRYSRTAGNPSLADVGRSVGETVDHVLPFDRRAMTAANIGQPFALRRLRFSGLERGLSGIVAEIEGLKPEQALSSGKAPSHGAAAVSTGN